MKKLLVFLLGCIFLCTAAYGWSSCHTPGHGKIPKDWTFVVAHWKKDDVHQITMGTIDCRYIDANKVEQSKLFKNVDINYGSGHWERVITEGRYYCGKGQGADKATDCQFKKMYPNK